MRWLLICILWSSNVAAQSFMSDPNSPNPSSLKVFLASTDKQLHMAGCFMISSWTTSYVYNRTADKRKAIVIGFGAGMVAGIAKEVSDIQYGNPDWADIAADVIGSGLGAVSITFTF